MPWTDFKEQIHDELERISLQLGVPEETRKNAASICTTILENGIARGRKASVVAATSLYAALREIETPISLRQVVAATEVPRLREIARSEIASCYRLLVTKVDMKIPVADPPKYVVRISLILRKPRLIDNAVAIARKSSFFASGRNPIVVAASAVYLASLMLKETIRQSDVAEAASVSEKSIRSCVKALLGSISD